MCIIAAYTDIKYTIIPNKLTLSMIMVGLAVTTYYYLSLNDFIALLYYYISVLVVYVINYVLWRLGVWAGGDVKLFTAISTLLTGDCIKVISDVCGFNMPLFAGSMTVITIDLMINSILSIIPIILIVIAYEIIKNKPYLKDELIKCISFNKTFILINSLTISIMIINALDIHNIFINMLLFTILSIIYNRLIQSKKVNIIISAIIIITLLYYKQINTYIIKYTLILLVTITVNIIKTQLLKKVLTKKVKSENLQEGMILAYNIHCTNNRYHFNNDMISDEQKIKSKPVIETKAAGLTKKQVQEIQNLIKTQKLEDNIQIKKTMPFAPYILTGLIITTTIGNPYQTIIQLIGVLI